MASRIEGERFIIAATLEPVETGQEFESIPPHMTLATWFQLQESWQFRLTNAMDRMFTHQDVYQNLTGGKASKFGENGEFSVREVLGAETGPAFALRALVKSFGSFRFDDPYANTFAPHVTNTPERKVVRREKFAATTVALISAHSDESTQHVVESFELRSRSDG